MLDKIPRGKVSIHRERDDSFKCVILGAVFPSSSLDSLLTSESTTHVPTALPNPRTWQRSSPEGAPTPWG